MVRRRGLNLAGVKRLLNIPELQKGAGNANGPYVTVYTGGSNKNIRIQDRDIFRNADRGAKRTNERSNH